MISVGQYYREQPNVILTRADTGIKSISDLKGKKVGIPGEYGSSWLALQAYLASAHMIAPFLWFQHPWLRHQLGRRKIQKN